MLNDYSKLQEEFQQMLDTATPTSESLRPGPKPNSHKVVLNKLLSNLTEIKFIKMSLEDENA